MLAGLVAWLHFISGLAYDFHLLFILPVLFVAWFAGAVAGCVVAVLSVLLWYWADRLLLGAQVEFFPLLFNKAMRLAIFLTGVWLLHQLRKVLERESQLAREDALTGLHSRREFYSQGRRALALAHRQNAPFTAVFIDLDRFKEVNDTLGHETGDQLLKAVSAALSAHLRASDIAGRLGGDEFALILTGMGYGPAAHYVEELRQRLLHAMQQEDWPVTFSIGVASYRRAPDDFERLLARADALMYEVKNSGRDDILIRECSLLERPDPQQHGQADGDDQDLEE
ncbi:MAG: Diguanylate cyclase DosC [Betaproteobacteria bacterium ADurb.Bin341]|nr:MAG: Diguanylate cyclase DosC [Betaproteobacteria bacterium ADurb.Bin341]